MAFQTVFKRYELKYMLTHEQKEKILKVMSDYMTLDQYGRTTIRNIYFDTENYRLIRRSIEKPVYREKTANTELFSGESGQYGVCGAEKEIRKNRV